MTLNEIYDRLKATEYPVAYNHFEQAQKPPFVAYLVLGTSNIGADDSVYQMVSKIRIELYTDYKDMAAEAKVEKVLDDAGIFYNKTEVWIQEESMFQILYESEVAE